jgi:hypothetical protein
MPDRRRSRSATSTAPSESNLPITGAPSADMHGRGLGGFTCRRIALRATRSVGESLQSESLWCDSLGG